jgi:hypothetical protein
VSIFSGRSVLTGGVLSEGMPATTQRVVPSVLLTLHAECLDLNFGHSPPHYLPMYVHADSPIPNRNPFAPPLPLHSHPHLQATLTAESMQCSQHHATAAAFCIDCLVFLCGPECEDTHASHEVVAADKAPCICFARFCVSYLFWRAFWYDVWSWCCVHVLLV